MFEDLFSQSLDEYASRYDVIRDNYTDVSDYYREHFGGSWRREMAADMKMYLGDTKEASIARQLARYDQGTRGVGSKYKDALEALGANLPPIRRLPNKRWRVSATIYVEISGSKGTRTASATFSNLNGTLQDLLNEYAEGGTMNGDDWMDSLDGLGSITIEEI